MDYFGGHIADELGERNPRCLVQTGCGSPVGVLDATVGREDQRTLGNIVEQRGQLAALFAESAVFGGIYPIEQHREFCGRERQCLPRDLVDDLLSEEVTLEVLDLVGHAGLRLMSSPASVALLLQRPDELVQ